MLQIQNAQLMQEKCQNEHWQHQQHFKQIYPVAIKSFHWLADCKWVKSSMHEQVVQ